jgi:hypothetical protein
MHRDLPFDQGTGRGLSPIERDLLAAMLSVDGLQAAGVLQQQATTARAAECCACGCGSIYLLIDQGASQRAEPLEERVIVEGDVLNAEGDPIGGVLLFQDDGWLRHLEIYTFGDEPLPLPAPAHTRLRLRPPRS